MSLDNISSLLDANLDDLADLPEFVVPPAGAYMATIVAITEKKVGEHPAVEFKFRLDSTVELASATDAPVKDGTECGVAFMLDNEFGVGKLKAVMKPLQVACGTSTVRETMLAAKGCSIMLVTKVRSGKGDKADQKYLDVHKVEVL